MGSTFPWILICAVVALSIVPHSKAEDPYKYYTWTVTYGIASPLGTPQQVILINGAFPGPQLDVVTNDNVVINVINKLDDPFLLTWNGIKQRKNSWEDGVLGTNCPIPPNSNFTYKFQSKDQIGTYTYFPSTLLHKAAGGYGSLNVYARTGIPVPYATPASYVSFLVGDWFKDSHKVLQKRLDSGSFLPLPNGIIINGQQETYFTGDQGKTYMFRISNVGLKTSFNFRIEGHTMKLVEVEGSHTMQNYYQSIDVHVGQSVAVLVTLDQPPKDYYMVASTRFTRRGLSAAAILHYSNSVAQVNGTIPTAPVFGKAFSVEQARTFRWNLSSNAARPNIQGSYHYGKIAINRTFVFVNSVTQINGKLRCAVNDVSHVNPATPLKLADYFNISGVFRTGSIQDVPSDGPARLDAAVIKTDYHAFVEIVFQNNERSLQSWHLDGHDFWVVGFGSGKWTPASRRKYNLVDATTRHTVQAYPRMWTAILVALDNQGMWNVRSAAWERQYLGQQFYLQVYTPEKSFSNEYSIPTNALLCGKAVGQKLL